MEVGVWECELVDSVFCGVFFRSDCRGRCVELGAALLGLRLGGFECYFVLGLAYIETCEFQLSRG